MFDENSSRFVYVRFGFRRILAAACLGELIT